MKRKYILIDCFQDIPCNPCEEICPHKAIEVGSPITRTPRYYEERCDGCAKCVAVCPGLCIYLVEEEEGSDKMTITLPYEFLPLPRKGELASVLDYNGREVGQGIVKRVKNTKSENGTALISVEVSRAIGLAARNILIRKTDDSEPELVEGERESFTDFQICRCEEVLLSELRTLAKMGIVFAPNLRRFSRVGLGLCQGKACSELMFSELSNITGMTVGELGHPKARPPVRPIKLRELFG